MQAFDVVVIGAGSGGLTAARRLALAGKHTALIERDLVGGDCLNWGCIPTKTLVALAASYYQLKQHRSSHPDLADTFPDFLAMKNRITTVQAEVGTDERRYYIDDPGVHLLHGTAHFLDTHTIRVNDQEIRFNHCIIATGSRPRIPSIPGLAATSYHTNETIFQLDRIPSSLAIIGGGPIGCEFAQAFQRLGCHVTIVEQNDRLLVREDPEASEVLLQAFREEGITIYLDTHIQATERQSDQQQLLHLLSHNWQAVVAINAILVAAGRQANIESLNLLAAGVQTNEHGIIVDTRLRTTAPHIWAVGDVTGGLFFTHVAAEQGWIAAGRVLGKGGRFHARAIPWCTFTDPEIARVGLTEAEARQRYGNKVRVLHWPFSQVDRALMLSKSSGFIKIITIPGWTHGLAGGELIGAQIAGPQAGELITPLTLLLAHRLPIGMLARTIHVYPTLSLGVRQALAQLWDSPPAHSMRSSS